MEHGREWKQVASSRTQQVQRRVWPISYFARQTRWWFSYAIAPSFSHQRRPWAPATKASASSRPSRKKERTPILGQHDPNPMLLRRPLQQIPIHLHLQPLQRTRRQQERLDPRERHALFVPEDRHALHDLLRSGIVRPGFEGRGEEGEEGVIEGSEMFKVGAELEEGEEDFSEEVLRVESEGKEVRGEEGEPREEVSVVVVDLVRCAFGVEA